MSLPLMRGIDPAADLDPEPDLALLADIMARPRPRHRLAPRPTRRILIGGGLAVAGSVVAAVVLGPSHGGSGIGDAAFRVSRSDTGTVSVQIRWDRIGDPGALQAALDRAGARTKVFVVDSGDTVCFPRTTTDYPGQAVQWHIPDATDKTDGLVVHPSYFPPGGTFVIVVVRAAPGSTLTAGPGAPAIDGYSAGMVVGPVHDPRC